MTRSAAMPYSSDVDVINQSRRYFVVGVLANGQALIRLEPCRTVYDIDGAIRIGSTDKIISDCTEAELDMANEFWIEESSKLHEGCDVVVIGGRKHKNQTGRLTSFVRQSYGRHTSYRACIRFADGEDIIDERWLKVTTPASNFGN